MENMQCSCMVGLDGEPGVLLITMKKVPIHYAFANMPPRDWWDRDHDLHFPRRPFLRMCGTHA